MRLIIFGPQGSGKGTQAELVARRHAIPYVSTGDIFRSHIKQQTALGIEVTDYLNRGQLVPDALCNRIVAERITQPDAANGFVLDGYPRNQVQLEFLDTITRLDAALVIDLTDVEAIHRLAGRLACVCGMSYHLEHNPPRVEGVCDRCGAKLFRRDDDQPEAIAQRLKIYHEETEPLLTVYADRKLLHRIDGSRSIEEVYEQVEKVLSQFALQR